MRNPSTTVLLVEDDPDDRRCIEAAFDELDLEVTVRTARDGAEALEFLDASVTAESTPRPDLVLLDLDLPGTHGLDVLEEIRNDPALAALPVLILTNSTAERDVVDTYDRSGNAYLTKPVDDSAYDSLIDTIREFWIDSAQLPTEPARTR
ncbi:response regulator [Natronolimnohabitans innermongolicus]|uniref:response regulator n=1 Tax=Natronolimnohabitans innermongolicus TaxID=253107 RepID=UPI0006775C24|nr:response regulator [Natronolimnohabitans innermongolicus]